MDDPNALIKKAPVPDFASIQKVPEDSGVKINPAQDRVDAQNAEVRPPVPAPSIDSLSPAARRSLEAEAKKITVDPAILWERTWLKLDTTQPTVAPADQHSDASGSTKDNLSLSTIRNF